MTEETKKAQMPDEIINLLMEYTRNSRADVMRFIGAAEQCGYTFTRAALRQPAQGEAHENRWCYGIDHAIQARERQTIIDRLVSLCERQASYRVAPPQPDTGAVE